MLKNEDILFRFLISFSPRIYKYLGHKRRVRRVEKFVKRLKIGDWFVLYQMSRNMNQVSPVSFAKKKKQ